MNRQPLASTACMAVTVACGFLLSSLVSSQLQAQGNKNAPQKTIGQLLKQADRGAGVELRDKQKIALPTVAAPQFDNTNRPAPVNLQDVKPPRTSQFIPQEENTDLNELNRITDQQIGELYRLTTRMKASPQRGELWLRLAELYGEKAEMIDHRIQDDYDRRLKDFNSNKSSARPQLNLKPAQEYNRKAIQLYEWFARDFPKDRKIDQVLFFLGYNYYELGDTKKGTAFYTKLVQEHPRSNYITDSNFALGEFYFENEKWGDAYKYYHFVSQRPGHRLYPLGVYKVAWCQFRLGRSTEALRTMEVLIRQQRDDARKAESNPRKAQRVKLEKEGLRDIVLFYSEIGDAKTAPGYFQQLVGAESPFYLEKLAYLYTDKGNREGGRFIFNHLIAQNPTSPKAFEYKYQIVQSYSTANRTRDFREELYSWIKDFGTGSAWYQANQGKSELIEKSKQQREQTLRSWLLQQHQTAQNSRAPYAQSLAFEGYKLYLTEFPQSPVVADMHFYFGELLYDMDRFDDAGAQYKWVVDNAPNSKFGQKATENTVLSLERNLPKEDDLSKRSKSLDPIQMEPRVSKFIESADAYTAKFPQSDRTPEIRFKVGRLYYLHNQFDKAVPYFKEIATKYPNTRFANYSANLLLDIYNLKKDYAGLEKAGQELLANSALAGTEAGKDIRGVLEKASFKKAQDLDASKDYKASAESFEAFAVQNPNSELALTALFNAAINFERAGITAKAVGAHAAVIRSNKAEAKALKPKSRRIVAKLYQDSGQLEDAAEAFQVAAQENEKDPLAANMFFNAAILYEALGQDNLALRNYEKFQGIVKGREQREALFSMASIERKRGKKSSAIQKYNDFLNMGGSSPEKNVEAAYRIYELYRSQRKDADMKTWRSRTLSSQRQYAPNGKGVGAEWAAKIKYDDVQILFVEFKSIKLNDLKRLKEQSDRKIAVLSRLNKELTEIVKLDSPEEIVASLSLIGQANAHMADSFLQAPVPPELKTKEEIAAYQQGVGGLAAPFVQKAKDTLKAAVDRAFEFEMYTPEYWKARTYLKTLDGSMVYDMGEKGLPVKNTSWMGL